MWRLIRFFFRLLKNDSATALTLLTVSPAAHAGYQLVVLAPAIESTLAALVVVKQHPGVLARVAPEPNHAQRVDDNV